MEAVSCAFNECKNIVNTKSFVRVIVYLNDSLSDRRTLKAA